MKKLTFVMLVITGVFFLGLGGFSKPLLADTTGSKQTNRGVYLNIMAKTKSEYYMIDALTGGKHNIEYMFNNAKNMANYKPTQSAINNVSNMDLFFYSGNNNDKWMGNFLSELNKSKVGVVNISRGIRIGTMTEDGNKVQNPYYWTGPNEYEVMLYNVTSALQEKDPANRSFYEDNYNKIVTEVNNMVTKFNNLVKTSKNKPIFLTRDNTFEYLLADLGIQYTVVPQNESFSDYISQNNLNEKDVVVIKDKSDKEKIDVNSITLQKENLNISYLELLENNLNTLSSVYK
ncbi:MAG: metal ABC transporter substrate-binding protein [Clostridium sp.]|uniref:metal ABC transporter substrate-binding protein n=1 Tax=Clostridium sp. TaxID=1506 RepID=UPI003EE79145